MISTHSNYPYIKWQVENKKVSSCDLSSQIASDTSDTWKEFVKKGINIYKQDREGFTPLHHALFHGNDDVSQYLISISEIKKYHQLKMGCFNLSIVDYALFRKACSNATIAFLERQRQIEKASPSPWDRAIKRMWVDPKALATLIECAEFPRGETVQMVKASLKADNLKALKLLYDSQPYDMAEDYDSSRQALEFACTKGDLDVAESILKARWKFWLKKPILGCNKAFTEEEIDRELKKAEKEVPLRISLAQDLLVDQGDNYPLHCALQSDNQQLIDFLLNFQDKRILHKVDSKGKTPLIIAAEKGLKITQKIIAQYICKGQYRYLSLEALAKPIEAARENENTSTESFLKEVAQVAKADATCHLLDLSYPRLDKFRQVND